MAITFGGDFQVAKSREQVYDFLTDPNKFAPLLPDYQGHQAHDDGSFTVKVKVGVSYIRGNAEVKMKLTESRRPEHASYEGSGGMAGGSVNVTARFDLAQADGGTKVNWKGEAQVFGKLASMAGGMLQPLARKQIDVLINSLKTALGS